jgi:hypothetical protein
LPEGLDLAALAGYFRDYVRDIRDVLDKGITVDDNVDGEIVTVSSITSATTDTSIRLNRRSAPSAVLVGKVCEDDGTPGTLTALPWRWDAGSIIIESWPGLTASTNYNITLVVLGG